MEEKIKILCLALIILAIIMGILILVQNGETTSKNVAVSNTNEIVQNEPKVEDEPEITDAVIVKNGDIQNENLIEEFINNTGTSFAEEKILKVYVYSNETEYIEKTLKFVPGTSAKAAKENEGRSLSEGNLVTVEIPNHDSTYEEFKEYYGYYEFNDGTETNEYRTDNWILERRLMDGDTQNEEINFQIGPGPLTDLTEYSEIPIVCSYSVKSSGYSRKFELIYNQRRDLGIYKIFEDDIAIYTYGGDANITIDGDMVYSLQDALENKVITINDILEQLELDEKYNVCSDVGFFSDGGSKEYYYSNYTILKYNKLDGTDDIVIGFRGSIVNSVDLNESIDESVVR